MKQKEKIKILYFVDGLGNGGGIQEMIIKWLENIDRNKIQIDILSYNRGIDNDNYIDRLKKYGCNVYIIQTYVSREYFFKSFVELNGFFNKYNDYDILHAHSSSKALFVMLYAKLYGIKIRILHSHSSRFIMSGTFPLLVANLFKPLVKSLTTDYFACSVESGEFLFGNNAVRNKEVTVIHNAVDVNKFYYDDKKRENMKKKLGLTDEVVIGNVGRFHSVKNHEFLLKIFEELLQIEENSILLLVGRGELEEIIRKNVSESNLDKKVIFLGLRKDVSDIMQVMDALVMPSLFEGLPVTAVEAQAVGVPCIFSDTITKESKILDNSCFINLSQDPKVWAEKIMEVIKDNKHRDTLGEIIEKGYEIKNETKRLENYYMSKVHKILS